jgi:integrase
MMIQDAIDKNILARDPRKGVKKGQWEWAKKRYPFESDDMVAIVDSAYEHSTFMGNLVTLSKETGLRIGELLGLCEDQIGWIKGKETLHVDRQLAQDENKKWVLADPKSTSSVRDVPLSIVAVKALRGLLDAQPEEAKAHTMPRIIDDGEPTDVTVHLVFAKPDGSPTTKGAVEGRWRKITEAAGVRSSNGEKCGIHRVRHTYAGDLIAAGVDLYVVSKMLGHRSIQVTEAFYAHLRREVLDTVRAVLNGGATVTPLRAAA